MQREGIRKMMETSSEGEVNAEFQEKDGRMLVRAARESIRTYLESKRLLAPDFVLKDKRFEKKRGCFVTLKQDDGTKTLRGCIGFPEPTFKLERALPESAVFAAVRDPRFDPIKISDLESLLVEVSILSKPALISVGSKKEVLDHVIIGRDGLILKWEYGSGLLLPQVATELNWDVEEFLCNLSMKAGANPNQWLSPTSMIYRFHAQVFQEVKPEGEVVLHPVT